MKQVRDVWVVSDKTLREDQEIEGVFDTLDSAILHLKLTRDESAKVLLGTESGDGWASIDVIYDDLTCTLTAERFALIEETSTK